jgi:opacity protein-like surface antigen
MSRSCLALLLAGVALPALGQSDAEKRPDRQPNSFALTFKTGDLKLAHDSQTISGNETRFERSANTVLAIEGETRLPRESESLSLGGEILRYNNLFKRASSTGAGYDHTLYTYALLAKSKYYFRPERAWQPYLGGGIGTVWSQDFSGPINGLANGLGYQAVAGMQLRTDRFGARLEYSALRARLTDDEGQKIDASVRGVFLGLSFFFGRH